MTVSNMMGFRSTRENQNQQQKNEKWNYENNSSVLSGLFIYKSNKWKKTTELKRYLMFIRQK